MILLPRSSAGRGGAEAVVLKDLLKRALPLRAVRRGQSDTRERNDVMILAVITIPIEDAARVPAPCRPWCPPLPLLQSKPGRRARRCRAVLPPDQIVYQDRLTLCIHQMTGDIDLKSSRSEADIVAENTIRMNA